jgi:hypothetical protein
MFQEKNCFSGTVKLESQKIGAILKKKLSILFEIHETG